MDDNRLKRILIEATFLPEFLRRKGEAFEDFFSAIMEKA